MYGGVPMSALRQLREKHSRRQPCRKAHILAVASATITALVGTLSAPPAGAVPGPAPRAVGTRPVVDARALAGEGRLAFVSGRGLWVLDGANGSLREVPVPRGFVPTSPTFSPDGLWLAYLATGKHVTSPDGGSLVESTVVVASAGGGKEERLATVDEPEASLIGWAPTSDTLAYVAPAVSPSINPYSPPSRVELWTPRGVRALARAPEVEGGAWAPNGKFLAVMSDTDMPRTKRSWTTSVTAYPVSGGPATTWASYSDTYHGDGKVTTSPAFGVGSDVAYLLPMGWWADLGIGVAVVDGNPGSPFDASLTNGSALPLAVISVPGASLSPLGTSMVNGAAGYPSASGTGEVAFTDGESALPIWQSGHVEHCRSAAPACTAVPQTASTVSLYPAWSPGGSELAYVVGKKRDAAGFGQSMVEAWYSSLQLKLYRPSNGSTATLALGTGAAVPTWSADGKSLLFVRDDGIWLWRGLAGRPVEVARPLFANDDWHAYYGQVRWAQRFSWWSPGRGSR